MDTNIKLMTVRVQKGLKQWELANQLGIHETEYSKIERGRKIPNRELQLRIASRLGVQSQEIF